MTEADRANAREMLLHLDSVLHEALSEAEALAYAVERSSLCSTYREPLGRLVERLEHAGRVTGEIHVALRASAERLPRVLSRSARGSG